MTFAYLFAYAFLYCPNEYVLVYNQKHQVFSKRSLWGPSLNLPEHQGGKWCSQYLDQVRPCVSEQVSLSPGLQWGEAWSPASPLYLTVPSGCSPAPPPPCSKAFPRAGHVDCYTVLSHPQAGETSAREHVTCLPVQWFSNVRPRTGAGQWPSS